MEDKNQVQMEVNNQEDDDFDPNAWNDNDDQLLGQEDQKESEESENVMSVEQEVKMSEDFSSDENDESGEI